MNYGLALLYVFLGGGLGSVCRFALGRWINAAPAGFPWSTFAANLLACIILGYLYALIGHKGDRQAIQLFFMAGFCGGFSTFSTFTMENYRLLQNQQWGLLFAYIMISVLCCLAGFFVGLKLYGMLR
jgi:CrcB protein